MDRRRFFYSLMGLGLGSFSYVRVLEPRWLELNTHTVRVPAGRIQRPVRILHLSDFHASDVVPLSFVSKAIDRGLETKPDVICLTGDYVTTTFDDHASYRRVLMKMANAAPVFACMGNHDGGSWVRPRGGYSNHLLVSKMLDDSGIRVLHNEATSVRVNNQDLALVGVGDLWSGQMNPEKAFAAGPESADRPVIVLAHNPDSKETLAAHAWNLLLCGHTHGGQLDLPILGTPLAPVRDHRFVKGLHDWKGRWIHVTKGIGNLHGMRINCRPEISVLDII